MVTENSENDLKYIQGTDITLDQIQKTSTEIKTEEKKEKDEEKQNLQYFTE